MLGVECEVFAAHEWFCDYVYVLLAERFLCGFEEVLCCCWVVVCDWVAVDPFCGCVAAVGCCDCVCDFCDSLSDEFSCFWSECSECTSCVCGCWDDVDCGSCVELADGEDCAVERVEVSADDGLECCDCVCDGDDWVF